MPILAALRVGFSVELQRKTSIRHLSSLIAADCCITLLPPRSLLKTRSARNNWRLARLQFRKWKLHDLGALGTSATVVPSISLLERQSPQCLCAKSLVTPETLTIPVQSLVGRVHPPTEPCGDELLSLPDGQGRRLGESSGAPKGRAG